MSESLFLQRLSPFQVLLKTAIWHTTEMYGQQAQCCTCTDVPWRGKPRKESTVYTASVFPMPTETLTDINKVIWPFLWDNCSACTQPTCGLGVVAQAVHQKKQRIHGWRGGGQRQRKQKKEEEQRKWEVWKFVEALKVLKMAYHSVVGSGNYWVMFAAQSQFALIRCLWTLILKAWRPLRVGASSSIDGGSAFQVLTYPWGNWWPSNCCVWSHWQVKGEPKWMALGELVSCSWVVHRCQLGRKQRLERG